MFFSKLLNFFAKIRKRQVLKPNTQIRTDRPKHCANREFSALGCVKMGMIRKNIPGQAAPGGEARFILDCDVSTNGKLEPAHIPAKLEDMHTWADRLFRGSITRELHEAMGPLPL